MTAEQLPDEHACDCGACDRETLWRKSSRGNFWSCTECGDRMPCRNPNCEHLDCAEAREHFSKQTDKPTTFRLELMG